MAPEERYLSEYQGRKRRRRRRITVTLILLGIVFLSIGSVWFFARSPLLHASSIRVEVVSGEKRIGTLPRDISGELKEIINDIKTDIEKKGFLGKFLGDLHYFNWSREISSDTVTRIPSIKSAVIVKNYRNDEIIVRVIKRDPFGIWCVSSARAQDGPPENSGESLGQAACYWFDDEGVMFEPAPNSRGNLIFVVHDESGRALGRGSRILKDDALKNFYAVLDILRNLNVSIKDIRMPLEELYELHVLTRGAPDLLFSLKFPPENGTEIIRELQSRGDFATLTYIDLRVENRVYYK